MLPKRKRVRSHDGIGFPIRKHNDKRTGFVLVDIEDRQAEFLALMH
jgi:hypothetical protein